MARIAMLRVALGLARKTFGEILTLAGAVLTGMTGNSIYPNPPVDMKTLKLATLRASGFTDWSDPVIFLCR